MTPQTPEETHNTRKVEDTTAEKLAHEIAKLFDDGFTTPTFGQIEKIETLAHHQLQKVREEHERKIDELRQHVATLYCAAGCECCRDTKVWEAESAVIAVMLGIPAYDDGSGFDFYKVRDSYRSKLDQSNK